MTKQLMTWARSVSGAGKRSGKAEFASQAALQSYLRQHPKADASKHTVAQPAKASERVEQQAAKQPRPGVDVPKPGGLPKEVAHLKATEQAIEYYRKEFPNKEKLLKQAAQHQKRAADSLARADKSEKAGDSRTADFLRGDARFAAQNYDAAMRAASSLSKPAQETPSHVPHRSAPERAMEQFAERRAQQGLPPASMSTLPADRSKLSNVKKHIPDYDKMNDAEKETALKKVFEDTMAASEPIRKKIDEVDSLRREQASRAYLFQHNPELRAAADAELSKLDKQMKVLREKQRKIEEPATETADERFALRRARIDRETAVRNAPRP